MRMILPCAGFGTRMGMKENQSKELLLYQGKPLIEFSLDICKVYHDFNPLIITRKEKTDLIEYCNDKNIETQIVEVQGEWANTVLQSKPFWEENNLLILPDTRFDPVIQTVSNISWGLNLGNNALFALHAVIDPWNWGIIEEYTLKEKPNSVDTSFAWGVIGFKDHYGETLFQNSKKASELKLENCGFTYLNEFKDLTRSGKIE